VGVAVEPMTQASLMALDWGTTSLRAWLLDRDGRVVEHRQTDDGILKVPIGGFPPVFATIAGPWLAAHGPLPALACGMIGSRQGWIEAPYAPCPCTVGDLPSRLAIANATFGHLAIVPGVAWDPGQRPPDVMRGEETQIFGALGEAQFDGLFVLPGTHSKWVVVEAGRIQRFATYMTGEIFAVLRQHSILGRGMAADDLHDAAAFGDGVRSGLGGSDLLHRLFEVRSLGLFDRLSAKAAPSYLSGLLLGSEIAAARAGFGDTHGHVTLIGAAGLVQRYVEALAVAGIAARPAAADVTVRGLWRIALAAGMIAA